MPSGVGGIRKKKVASPSQVSDRNFGWKMVENMMVELFVGIIQKNGVLMGYIKMVIQ